MRYYLDAYSEEQEKKWERLWDLYEVAISKIPEATRVEIERKLNHVEALLWPPKGTSKEQKVLNKKESAKEIRAILRTIHIAYDNAGLWTPTKDNMSEYEKFEKDF